MRALPIALTVLLAVAAVAQDARPRLVAQVGHSARVWATAFSTDGRLVLTAGDDRTARVWDAETGAELARLAGHQDRIFRIAFVGDGRRVVTASFDGTARVWDVATQQTLRTIETGPFVDVAIGADGRRIAVGGDPGAVIDVETGERVAMLATGRDDYGPLAFSSDGRRVMTAWEHLEVRVWDAQTGAVLASTPALDQTADEPQEAVATPDGRLVVVHRLAGSRVVDVEAGRLVTPDEPFLRDLYGLRYSADGTRAVVWRGVPLGTAASRPRPSELTAPGWDEAWGGDTRVEVWDVDAWDEGADAPRLRLPVFATARLSPDGRRLLTTVTEGSASALWNVERGTVDAELAGRAVQPSFGAFADEGRALVTDGVWDLTRGTWSPLPDAWRTEATDSDRVLLVAESGALQVRQLDGVGPVFALDPPDDVGARVVAIDRSAARLAESVGQVVRVWNVDTGAVAHSIDHERAIDDLSFSADGRRLATLSWRADGSASVILRVWNVETGAALVTIRPPGVWPDLAFSSGGERLATTAGDSTFVWDTSDGALLARLPGEPAWLTGPGGPFSPDGQRLLLSSYRPSVPDSLDGEPTATVWDVASGEAVTELGPFAAGFKVGRFTPDGRRVLTLAGDGIGIDREGAAQVWDAATGALVYSLDGYRGSGVESAVVSPDGSLVATVGLNGTVQLWDAASGAEHAALFAFRDGTFAVVDAEGRYDASNGGDIDGLAWAVDTPDGLEPVRLAQLKARYYDPGLLAKHLGFNAEPLRDVAAFRTRGLALPPSVEIASTSPSSATIRVANRGGGIGAVQVFVNGTQVTGDARPASASDDSLTVNVDLTPFRRLFVPDTLNVVSAVASNAEGSLQGRRQSATVFVPATRGDEEAPVSGDTYRPHLWAVLVGVGDYAGDDLDLRFAGSDAADVAQALGVAATRLFGPERTHLTLLSTEPGADGPPTRVAITDALAHVAAQADSRDVLIVYLAGHGVVHGGADGDFYFLTRDATSSDLADAAVRQAVALSSNELEDRLAAVPTLKRVLILDTCASGRVVEQLSAQRDVPGAQVRSLDRLKDHTGTFVLAGSAADAVSYEATQYGQGLLTWSLLEGMRLAADAQDNALDVLAWFDHAQRRVPELARSIGGIQRPELVMPTGRGSYPVGRVRPEDQARIPLQSPRPVVLRASFQDDATYGDPLALTRAVNEALRELSVRGDRPPLVFVDAEGYPEAYRLAGRYTVEGGQASVRARLLRGLALVGSVDLMGDAADISGLATRVVAQAEAALGALYPTN